MTLSHLPPLTLAQRLALDEAMAQATRDAQALLHHAESVSREHWRSVLERGARIDELKGTTPKPEGAAGWVSDAWQTVWDCNRTDLFEDLLAADACRPQPAAHTPSLLARAAAFGRLDWLDLLLARGARVNQKGPVPFLFNRVFDQEATGIVGALVARHDATLDRLFDAGALPQNALGPPRMKSPSPPEWAYRCAPRALIHLAQTPHAVRRLVAAGDDPNALDDAGRTALDLLWDGWQHTLKCHDGSREAACHHVHEMAAALMSNGVDPYRGTYGSPLVGAAEHGLWSLVIRWAQEGIGWPTHRVPKSPQQAAELMRHGVRLQPGAHWWTEWIEHNRLNRDTRLQDLESLRLDVNAVDPVARTTPLVAALRKGKWQILEFLLNAGADVSGYPGHPWSEAFLKPLWEAVDPEGESGKPPKRQMFSTDIAAIEKLMVELGSSPVVEAAQAAWSLDNRLHSVATPASRHRL